MVAANKFNSFVEKLAEKTFNLQTDTLKIMLSNTAPAAANGIKTDITEIAAGNGYTAGGVAVTLVSSGQTAGLYTLIVNDGLITAAGGSIGPFQYAVLYDDTTASKDLICWWDRGAALTLVAGDSVNLNSDQVAGILTLQ